MDSKNKNYSEIELLLKSIDKKNQILSKYLKYFNQKQLDFINLIKTFRSKFEEDHFSDGGRSFINYLGEFKEANRILNDFINLLKEKNLYISEETQLEIKHTPKGSTSLNYLVDKLSTYLVENIEGKKIACMGGSFKPPHSGHFQVVKEALTKLPNIDQFIIFVGNAERDGITQEQSIQIWGIYQKYLSDKVEVVPTDKPPIRSIYDYAKENQGIEVNWVLGIRKGQEEDKADYKRRTSAVEKYPNLKTLVINTEDPEISGTNARAALENKDEFLQFVPDELSNEDKDKVWNILSEKQVDEIKVNNPVISNDDMMKFLQDFVMGGKIANKGISFYNVLVKYGYKDSDNMLSDFIAKLSPSNKINLQNDLNNLKEIKINIPRKFHPGEKVKMDGYQVVTLTKDPNRLYKKIDGEPAYLIDDESTGQRFYCKEKFLTKLTKESTNFANQVIKEFNELIDEIKVNDPNITPYKQKAIALIQKYVDHYPTENNIEWAGKLFKKINNFTNIDDINNFIWNEYFHQEDFNKPEFEEWKNSKSISEIKINDPSLNFNKAQIVNVKYVGDDDTYLEKDGFYDLIDLGPYYTFIPYHGIDLMLLYPKIYFEDIKFIKKLDNGTIEFLKTLTNKKIIKEIKVNNPLRPKIYKYGDSPFIKIDNQTIYGDGVPNGVIFHNNTSVKNEYWGEILNYFKDAIYKDENLSRILGKAIYIPYDKSKIQLITNEKDLQEDKIPGGLAASKTIRDIAKHHNVGIIKLRNQLTKGIEVEMEHTNSKSVAREIAMDHLFEDPKYYDKLEKIETNEIKVNNPSISSEELFNYITKNNIGKNRDKYLEILNRYGYFKSDNNGYVPLFFDQLSSSDRMKLYNDLKNYVNSKIMQENKSLSNGDFKKYINYLDKIVKHCCDELQIPRPKINIINNDKYPLEHQSFGGYKPGKNEIDLVIKNRTCSDSGRTLAHELKHADQDHRGVLTPDSGKDGSEHENEANSFSGKIMREFNRKYPEILVLTLKSVNKSYAI